VGTAVAFEGTGYGRVVLTATDATQYAWEGDQVIGRAENSVFTHYLVEGLRTGQADTDADGRITLDELYDYVFERVVSEAARQTPGKWSYKQQGEIIIARNPRPMIKPAELPIELRQASDSPFAEVRVGAVRELERLLRGSDQTLDLAAQAALERLTEDDSRQVSNMATESLAVYTGTRPPGGEKSAEAQPAPPITPPAAPHPPTSNRYPETPNSNANSDRAPNAHPLTPNQ
jgi:hypothetical protein